VGRSVSAPGAILRFTLVLLVCGVAALFCQTQPASRHGLVVVVAALAASFWVVRATDSFAVGVLCWDGDRWSWHQRDSTAYAVTGLHSVFASPQWVLLCVDAPGKPPRWLWLHGSRDDAQWRALRRALAHPSSPRLKVDLT